MLYPHYSLFTPFNGASSLHSISLQGPCLGDMTTPVASVAEFLGSLRFEAKDLFSLLDSDGNGQLDSWDAPAKIIKMCSKHVELRRKL